MSDLQFSITWDKNDLRNLKKYPAKFKRGILKGFKNAVYYIESQTKKNLSGKVLKVRTGRLRSSIKSGVKVRGDNIIGYVGSDVKYARPHELGAIITPKAAEYLKFKVASGQWVITKSVKIPKRSFIEPAFKDNERKIKQIIIRDIKREINK